MASKSQVRVRSSGWDTALYTKMSYTLYRSNGTVYNGQRNTSYSPYFFFIRDVVGTKQAYNPVLHSRYRFRPFGAQPTVLHFSVGNPKCVYYPYFVPGGSMTAGGLRNSMKPTLGFNRSDTIFKEFADAAVLQATEEISVELDGLNLIRDVLTVRGLCRQIVSKISVIWRILTRFASARRLIAGKSLHEISKLIANGYLLNEFGIQPIIREVTGLLSAFDRALERVRFLQRTQNSTFPCRYGAEHWLDRPIVTGFTDTVSGHAVIPKFKNGRTQVKFNSTIVVQNRLTGLDGFLGTLNGLLAAFGFGHVVTFAWDLVPFSFVVDWFYQINHVLDRYVSINPFGGSLRVINCGTSHLSRHTFDIFLEGPDLTGYPQIATVNLDDYSREVGIPARVSSYIGSALTSKQWAILTALAFQRV